jgi:FixJ family two-component response regulator
VALSQEVELEALRNCYASLSGRERQVMSLVISGLSNRQVGDELGITETTVKAHRGRVMEKMKADSIADLVKMAGKFAPLVRSTDTNYRAHRFSNPKASNKRIASHSG